MLLLDFSFPTPAENLACDEALLDFFEERGGDGVLRFWEPETYFVVVGYGNHVEKEVNVTACEAEEIPILRRCSGGGTVLQGPGCLNYSLVLKIDEDGPVASITAANRFIMERNRTAIERECRMQNVECGIEVRGHTDLALDTGLKFSGNAQRRKKHFLLFHGTFLLNFDISLIDKFLRMPSKEPDYRKGRSHKNFLTNLNLSADAVKRSLRKTWSANDGPAGRRRSQVEVVPHDAIGLLARDKYVTKEWNFKF
jgi:lipoate-protein ligase A